ncbi:unnamed protein product, partial [Vitis vinifera]|uniref:Uncharacterized protein n=1 Tax=Vitis vinifera TaxID=29760 RepID=D7T547_VITVI
MHSPTLPELSNKRTLLSKPFSPLVRKCIKNITQYSSMTGRANSRTTFINSSINLARLCNFHGLDLD